MPKKTVPAGFVGFLYGGIIKHGYVRFFITNTEVETTFDGFKSMYGNELRGRYVASELYETVLNSVKDKLVSNKFKNIGENIFEISIANASNTIKEFANVKKIKILGKSDADAEGSSDEKDPKPADKKVKPVSETESADESDAKPIAHSKSKKAVVSDDESDAKPVKKSKSKSKKAETDDESDAKPAAKSKGKKAPVESDDESDAKPAKKSKAKKAPVESDDESDAKPAKKVSPKKSK
jgi:hypothetical protein